MAACEPGGRLSYANVADVDAATDSLGVLEPLRHIDEPAWIQAGGVLEKDDGPIRALAKARVQLAHRGDQAVGLCLHLMVVVDDQARDPACEAAGGATPPRAGPPALAT